MKKPIKWFLDVHLYGQLDLEPPYQRRSVWTPKDRTYFLDTVFRNYPCPAVFVHKEADHETGKMYYRVVDGRQRLETIMLFFNNELSVDQGYGDARLNGKRWKDLEAEPDLKARFLNYGLTVEEIDTGDKYVIHEVFERLNRNSRKLERQELRHAKYDGWLITMAEGEAEKEEWERLGIATQARMRRMKDVQCISELLAVILKNRIAGFNQDAIDALYAQYDAPHETVSGFHEDVFLRKLEFTKQYILEMEDNTMAVSKYARSFNDFYSLWAFVAIHQHQLPSYEATAESYAEFMGKVAAIGKTKDIRLLREYEGESYADAYAYLKNSGHSATDQPQREARNSILKRVLLSAPDHDEKVPEGTAASRYFRTSGLGTEASDF